MNKTTFFKYCCNAILLSKSTFIGKIVVLCTIALYIILPWNSKAQTGYFPPLTGDIWETTDPEALNWDTSKIQQLLDFLATENSRAFLVLHKGKIVMEHYFNGFGRDELWYWASAGKSLTAFAVGMAVEQQKLSIQDTVSDYLGKWTSCDQSDEEKITIWNLLTMTSGFDTDVDNLDCTADTCLQCKYAPGSRWYYHNAPYTLLDGVLESATGLGLNVFLQRNLFRHTGMSGAFVRVGDNNVFWSKARSMARFGLLMQHRGIWDGKVVLGDDEYFDAMVTPSQSLNPSYGYLWWLNGQSFHRLPGIEFSFPGSILKDAPSDLIAALGKNGQIINIVPSLDLVMVRMGDSSDDFPIGHLLNMKIWQYMKEILPSETSIIDHYLDKIELNCYPNPSNGQFTIDLPSAPQRIRVADALGRPAGEIELTENKAYIFLDRYPSGLYSVSVQFKNGKFANAKIINKM